MTSRHCSNHRQRGLSIIEFMVGIAIGLFIVGGATTLFVSYLKDNRKLLLETRVNQDLRAAADLVVRDLRRAGYWRNSLTGVFSATTTSVATNVYSTINSTDSTTDGVVGYYYDKDGVDGTAPDPTTETFGFQRAVDPTTGKYVLQMKNGSGTWQPITDPTTLSITAFSVTTSTRTLDLYTYCDCLKSYSLGAPACTSAALAALSTRPQLTIRRYELSITGQSATDSSVTRTIRETVRARNDRLSGSCPSST